MHSCGMFTALTACIFCHLFTSFDCSRPPPFFLKELHLNGGKKVNIFILPKRSVCYMHVCLFV